MCRRSQRCRSCFVSCRVHWRLDSIRCRHCIVCSLVWCCCCCSWCCLHLNRVLRCNSVALYLLLRACAFHAVLWFCNWFYMHRNCTLCCRCLSHGSVIATCCIIHQRICMKPKLQLGNRADFFCAYIRCWLRCRILLACCSRCAGCCIFTTYITSCGLGIGAWADLCVNRLLLLMLLLWLIVAFCFCNSLFQSWRCFYGGRR